MEQTKMVIIFCIALVITIIYFIFMMKIQNKSKAKAYKTIEQAKQDGLEVTGYLLKQRRYYEENKSVYYKATYKYYTNPGSKMYKTNKIMQGRAPAQITLYVNPNNPKKTMGELEMIYGKGPGKMTIPFLLGFVLFFVVVRVLGILFQI
ncbi:MULTISPECIES: DUF3592 domain-containing protein [unclassified Breznakia]|uniref:DUF3592 domain-containing protein n=1 Tax=unclassified Breznakia TaxID=2623764 RepID=UPI00247302D1|nr:MULTISPECIES: DUF3592 domain-containing protein [unclassified Breznakia]MDH6366822.1 putative small secreted protein [Breznakia sp. PH1-1]MDH6404000.1 putative small secreted protein [Breznakia sp. PF1-11]MDH6411778.1 putative small secreted protein [Breznakia sp. PFB1-11]MDH6413988.1 putative small secreted protein [Breznakia sp. PFB1-14]MDH6416418.1 putative small secreted protein [Breznakia sp. PFB1-4]